jgi:hypothetical protein
MKKFLSGCLVISLLLLVGCVASTPPAVGVWDVDLNTPLGVLTGVLTVNEDGSGQFASDSINAPLSGIMFEGDSFAFTAEVEAAPGQTLVLEFNGTVSGDSVSGEFGSDFGAFTVTGSRQ